MGKVPDDLPEADTPVATGPSLAALPAVEEELNSDTDLGFNRTPVLRLPAETTPHPDPPPVLPSPTTDSDLSQHDPVTMKSDIPALDHFPVPPVHFPLPHLQRGLTGSLDGPIGNPPSYGRQVTPPVSAGPGTPDLTATTPTELAAAGTQTPSPTTNKRTDTSTYLPAHLVRTHTKLRRPICRRLA
jgi:hypothetical protein